MERPNFGPARPRIALVLSVTAIAAALALSGCGHRETRVQAGDRDQILELGNLDEPVDLDPQIITSDIDSNIAYALFEGLTAYDPKDLHPIPGVAERWESNADATVWTFHLRADARWSNGDPVTAGDFVYACHRILSPKLASEYVAMHFHLKNGEAYYQGKITDFGQVGAKALDDRTLVLTLWHSLPFLPAMLCTPSWYPVHRATLEKFGAMDERSTAWTRPGNLVGNGPFVLADWRPNEVIRVTKSPTYWNRDSVRLQGCNFYPIEDPSTEEEAFRAGQLHVTTTLAIDKIAVYKKEHPELLRESLLVATYYFRFNVTKPPLNDARVRRALSLSIDRREITEDVTKGGEVPAGNLVPPGTGGFTSTTSVSMDIETAQRLLAEAGFPAGRGFPQLELLYNTQEINRKTAEAVQQMWRKNLGINSTLANEEAKVQEDAMRQGNYQIARYAWSADFLDPSTFLELLTTDNGNNQTGWSDAQYDRLFGLTETTGDNAKRFEYFQECEAILARESPIMPIYFYERNNLVRTEVKGWYENLLNIHPLNAVYLEPPH
jgi:oligopeptide transport system substrate-binding protein